MSDLSDLYQELIVDHSRRPRNFRILDNADQKVEGHNPLCGDRVTIFLQYKNEKVKDVSFQGSGCAISTASASLLTETLRGKTREEARAIFDRVHAMLTKGEGSAEDLEELGKLAVFSGVCQYPSRVKCASLAWHTAKSAWESHTPDVVSTE